MIRFLSFRRRLILGIVHLTFFMFRRVTSTYVRRNRIRQFASGNVHPRFVDFNAIFLLILNYRGGRKGVARFRLILRAPTGLSTIRCKRRRIQGGRIGVLVIGRDRDLLAIFNHVSVMFAFRRPSRWLRGLLVILRRRCNVDFKLFDGRVLHVLLFGVNGNFLCQGCDFLVGLFFLGMETICKRNRSRFHSPTFLTLRFGTSSVRLRRILCREGTSTHAGNIRLPMVPLMRPLRRTLLLIL